jgi:hypothetical protein
MKKLVFMIALAVVYNDYAMDVEYLDSAAKTIRVNFSPQSRTPQDSSNGEYIFAPPDFFNEKNQFAKYWDGFFERLKKDGKDKLVEEDIQDVMRRPNVNSYFTLQLLTEKYGFLDRVMYDKENPYLICGLKLETSDDATGKLGELVSYRCEIEGKEIDRSIHIPGRLIKALTMGISSLIFSKHDADDDMFES